MVIFPIANSDNTLEEAISERNSIIDILRLVYAIVVIFGHSFALSRSPAGFSDPVMNLIGFDYSSALAVDGFFLLSGILVSQSWVRNPSLGAFVLSRALRVWPGLIFCLLVTIFLFLPLSKEAVSSKYSYISHIFDPAIASYFINNTLFGSQEFKVSGYFVDSKYGINGSLWSLRGEIIMYIFVGILGFLGLYKKGLEILATIIVVLIASIFLMHDKVFPIIGYNGQFVAPVLFFCAGMLLYILRSLIRVGLIHVIFILFLYLMTDGYISKVAFYVFFMAGNVMLIGLDQKIKTLKMGGDLSYGIYLYGFPIQHLIGQYFHQANPYQHFMLSITFVLPFAWISWRFIEKPSIFASKTLLNKLLIFFEVIVRWAKDNKPYQQTSICAKNFVYPLLMLVLLFANTIFFHYIYNEGIEDALRGDRDTKITITSYGPIELSRCATFNVQPSGKSALWVTTDKPVGEGSWIVIDDKKISANISGLTLTGDLPRSILCDRGLHDLQIMWFASGKIKATVAKSIIIR